MKLKWVVVSVISVICISSCFAEPKRSWGISRSRTKSTSTNVRRRGQYEQQSKVAPVQQKSAVAPQSNGKPDQSIGAPPPYSPVGVNGGKSNLYAAPPSYSSATGGMNAPYNPNYPRQNYGTHAGMNNFQQAPPPSYGWNANNGYGGGHHPQMSPNGFAMGNPAMSGYGGYGGGAGGGFMPNYGGYGGAMPMYKQKSSGAMTGIVGGALTGLATYQLARAIGGGFGGHSSTQHIYHHHEHPQQPQVDQTPLAAPVDQTGNSSSNINNNNNSNNGNVALQPANVEDGKAAGADDQQQATPVPDFANEYPYSTIHPSLFPYALNAPSNDLDYWAKSHTKQLNL